VAQQRKPSGRDIDALKDLAEEQPQGWCDHPCPTLTIKPGPSVGEPIDRALQGPLAGRRPMFEPLAVRRGPAAQTLVEPWRQAYHHHRPHSR
jgi:hypothetical protein